MSVRNHPETIKVGAIIYQIVDVPGLHNETGEKYDGHILYSKEEIRLEADLASQTKRQTLWHEVIHAILIQAGHQKHDEGQVDALAYGIMNVLQDNPWLIESPEGI
jgi:hypothetical protein